MSQASMFDNDNSKNKEGEDVRRTFDDVDSRYLNEGCTFCKIIKGELDAPIVFEDEESLAFLDHRPLLHGHTLLVPKHHFETVHDLPSDLRTHLMEVTKSILKGVEDALNADGSFMAINTNVSQSVPHFHIHAVPRWESDSLFSKTLSWRRYPYKDNQEKEVKKKVSSSIHNILSSE